MARKRLKGRFAKEEAGAAQTGERVDGVEQGGRLEAGKKARAPRPQFCRIYTRKRLAEALPEVTETLIREAKKGSVQHLKLLVTICGLNLGGVAPEPKKHPGRNLEQILMDEWKKDKRSGEAVGEQ